MIVWVIALAVDLCIASDVESQLVLRDKAQISVCALVSNKIILALLSRTMVSRLISAA